MGDNVRMRRVLPLIAAGLCGLIIVASFVFKFPWLDGIASKLLEGGLILAAFALLLGLLNLLAFHARRIRAKAKGVFQSILLMVTMVFTISLGIALPASAPLSWIYNYLLYPLQATLGALLVFYAVNAALYAFKLQSGAAIILLVSSLFFLFLLIPFISGLSPIIPALRNWLTLVPLGAGMRGILLGIALGTITSALRILFLQDHPYTGNGEKR
jgi:hypothetical protein